ncbi:unnamed protein product [Candidula unifasciata]|uniref:Ubiquinone biosynthesis monooxygenase COQ6, mitochondrial n=1 Tax=Candidula unifasciata TaxID=100452 RepID=A0A8S3ZAR0_9EUPU|nr:unnamed protein product [Candidula unifasciata]
MALRLTAKVFEKRFCRFCQAAKKFNRAAYSTTTDPTQDAEYSDIVISGGGMVGAAMACALANNKFLKDKKIVLLESQRDTGDFVLPEKYSNRTCALSPATIRLLDSFGAWKEIEAMRCHPVLRMQVWESCSDALITFSNPDMTESLAHIVENDVILAGIMKALKAVKNRVDVRYESKAVSYKIPEGHDPPEQKQPFVEMILNDNKVLRTRLLIGADGMNSEVRKAAKFHTIRRDYGQSAVVATLVLADGPANNTAWQRFLPKGPIAFLPLSDKLSSLVWTTTPEDAKHLLQIPRESFVDAVNDALWNDRDKNAFAGQVFDFYKNLLRTVLPGESNTIRQLPPTVMDVQEGSRAAFPLTLIHASHYVKPRVALVGDAGHRLHPLAGQGVNLGFGDVQCLSDILGRAAYNGSDLGSLPHLLQYETERQRHNVPVMVAIDGLQRLYCNQFTPFVVLRNLGLHTVQSLPFLKNAIINQASV